MTACGSACDRMGEQLWPCGRAIEAVWGVGLYRDLIDIRFRDALPGNAVFSNVLMKVDPIYAVKQV